MSHFTTLLSLTHYTGWILDRLDEPCPVFALSPDFIVVVHFVSNSSHLYSRGLLGVTKLKSVFRRVCDLNPTLFLETYQHTYFLSNTPRSWNRIMRWWIDSGVLLVCLWERVGKHFQPKVLNVRCTVWVVSRCKVGTYALIYIRIKKHFLCLYRL